MNSDQQSNYWKPTDEDEADASSTAVSSDTLVADTAEAPQAALVEEPTLSWKAQEYVHVERNTGWFIGVGVVTAVLLAISIFLMKSITFSLLIVVMAVSIILLALRPPRSLNYTLTNKGLYVMDELYPFSHFKAFGVMIDGEEFSVVLLPTKRFSPEVTVYFPSSKGEQIVDYLGRRLPMQELTPNLVDRLIRKLRL